MSKMFSAVSQFLRRATEGGQSRFGSKYNLSLHVSHTLKKMQAWRSAERPKRTTQIRVGSLDFQPQRKSWASVGDTDNDKSFTPGNIEIWPMINLQRG